jgi:trk system potassium uptake protein TrkH
LSLSRFRVRRKGRAHLIHPWSLYGQKGIERERERWGRGLTSPRVAALSFASLVALGTLGLLIGPGFYTGPRLGFIDALFTATSAVCVTGLVVVDTGTAFTLLGQAWIAALIQAGGLGILTFTTAFALAAGKRTRLAVEGAAGVETLPMGPATRRSLIGSVIGATLAIEGIGAVGLWLAWKEDLGPLSAVWHAVFHAISAFCNAGFSTFSDSLVGYRRSPGTLGLIMVLVVLGGIGFVVLEDLRRRLERGGRHRLTLHSTLALAVTAVLLLLSWVMFTVFEWGHQLRDLGIADSLVNGAFMAVTPRTAGFNTVDYGSASNPSVFLTMLLMIVGGSPGSTAGGIKTVSLGVLMLVLLSRIRGEARVSAFGRTLPRETIQRSVGLVVGGVMLLALAVFLLLVTEVPAGGPESRSEFIMLVFEAASAFGTVGLTMGATSTLSALGKLIVLLLMYIGRIGPLVLVAAMTPSSASVRRSFRFGEEDVMIG